MGKLKISKAKKSRSSKGTSGIPNWLLSTIIIVVVIAVLAVCISTAIFSNGLIGRWSTAMKLGDIEVSQNMMSYFFRTNYINQINTYAQYVGENGNPYSLVGIDPNKSLKDQTSYDGKNSWYDYFLNLTKNTVSQYLVYATAANAAGIELDDEDHAYIDETIDNIVLNIRYSTGMYTGYSDDACIALAYGEGVKESDVREALELQTLAEKLSNTKGEAIEKNVKADKNKDKITAEYKENSKLYNYVDFLIFSFDVYYDDVAAEEYPDTDVEDLTDEQKKVVLKEYNKKIETARKNAEELAKKTTVAEYNAFIAEFVLNEEYETVYDKALKDVKDLPKEEEIKTIKDKISENVLKELAEGKTTATDDTTTKDVTSKEDSSKTEKEYYIYDIKIEKAFYDAIKTYKNNLFSTVLTALDAANTVRATYTEPENEDDVTATTWAFDPKTKVLTTNKLEAGDGSDGKEVTEITEKSELTFSAEVALLTKASYKIDTLSRDFAYLLFTKEDAAKTAIEAVKKLEDLDKDSFLKLAEDEKNPADAYQFIEDCVIYSMESDALDEWLFDEDLKKGDYTTTPLVMEDGSYMVALYVKPNTTPEWKYRVINKLIDDKYTEFEDGIFEKYEKQLDESYVVLNKLKDDGYVY